ncbi:helix-turn-helix domain-containing protein, partial [Anaerotruncus rubiinfantis]
MEKPNYYAVLPACVRYDDRLKPAEKLLFAELTSLSQAEGYSWASNGYFSRLYKVSKETVSRWLSHLQECGYIKVSVDQQAGNGRRIIVFDPVLDQGV